MWQYVSSIMLFSSFIMLSTVFIVGESINGATRWLSFGLLHIQPSEFSKFSLFCYLSSYLTRRIKEVNSTLWGLLKPIVVIFILSIFLLLQPDLGSIVVIFCTTLSVLFLSGVRLWQFFSIISIGIVLFVLLIIDRPYRLQRVISFWNPWEDPFGSGYQLTQSFMAFGRGKWFGQGLGNSIQKLEYLPEAHTDFIFAILGEELGFVGVIITLLMIILLVLRGMFIGRHSLNIGHCFSGFLAFFISVWLSFQSLFNIGVVLGILPTKGLTLPFISYGGSSFLIMAISVVILLRIDFENKLIENQAFSKGIQ